jgi:hypothetical protein
MLGALETAERYAAFGTGTAFIATVTQYYRDLKLMGG